MNPAVSIRAIPLKSNPQTDVFAKVTLVFKEADRELEESEFKFVLASAIQTVHGDTANEPQTLHFKAIDQLNYLAIIKFKSAHYHRVITSLLLSGTWRGKDCRFDIVSVAQSPCFLN